MFSRVRKYAILSLLVLSAVCSQTVPSYADSEFAHQATRSLVPFVAVSELGLYAGGHDGRHEAIQGAKALLAANLVTEGLKRLTHEERPDGSDHYSFPSGHAATAFAMATTLADYKPSMRWEAYSAATLISWSRVDLDRHHWHDVIAGAAIGYLSARRFTSSHIGVTPAGLGFQTRF